MGYPQIIINHQFILVLQPMVTWGFTILRNPHFWDIIHFWVTYAQLIPFI